MISGAQNIIRTHGVEVEFENSDNAFESRKCLSEVCKHILIPKLELLIEQYSLDDALVQIDTINVDAGTLTNENWEKEFVDNSINSLKKFLEQHIVSKTQHRQKTGQGKNLNKAISDKDITYSGEIEISRQKRNYKKLITYLKTGILSWNVTAVDNNDTLKAFFVEALSDGAFTNDLVIALKYDISLFERLVYLLKREELFYSFLNNEKVFDVFKEWLIRGTKAIRQKSILRRDVELIFSNEKFLKKAVESHAASASILYLFPKYRNKLIADYSNKRDVVKAFDESVMLLEKYDSIELFSLLFAALKKNNAKEFLRTLYQSVRVELTTLFNEQQFIEDISALSEKLNVDIKDISDVRTSKEQSVPELKLKIKKDIASNPEDRKTDEQSEEIFEHLFISNAGLVLFHPFLENFFHSLGLTNQKRQWLSQEAQMKAVCILQYLVSGTLNPLENDLILNKVFCGYPKEAPIAFEFAYSDFEINEVKELLGAVIAHWQILSGTSVDGLREGFLMRNGKLEKRDYGWKLIVEQRGIDVLLESLPWSFGNIKTPWMQNEEILIVDWI